MGATANELLFEMLAIYLAEWGLWLRHGWYIGYVGIFIFSALWYAFMIIFYGSVYCKDFRFRGIHSSGESFHIGFQCDKNKIHLMFVFENINGSTPHVRRYYLFMSMALKKQYDRWLDE